MSIDAAVQALIAGTPGSEVKATLQKQYTLSTLNSKMSLVRAKIYDANLRAPEYDPTSLLHYVD